MFTLEPQWDRPNKISSQTSEHILRLRMIPQSGASGQTLPLNMAIALDTSQSMQGEKLQSAKQACRMVIDQLRDQDRLSLASFSTSITPLLENISGDEQASAQSAIAKLDVEGVTRTDLALNWLLQALPPEKGTARAAVLITDGHSTNSQGGLLQDLDPLIEQAGQLARAGIILFTVGLGNAGNFNTEFLVNLSDRGRGAFVYADTPDRLTPLLQKRLLDCQTIIAEAVTFQFKPASGVRLQGFCQISPEYRPLEQTTPNQIIVSGVKGGDIPTDVLVAVQVAPLEPGQNLTRQTVLQVEVSAEGMTEIDECLSINHTQSYREAQEINQEVNQDRLYWIINQCSTELTRSQDPQKTGELLLDLQVAANKSGRSDIAQQANQQLQELEKNGNLDPHQSTTLFQKTRNLKAKS